MKQLRSTMPEFAQWFVDQMSWYEYEEIAVDGTIYYKAFQLKVKGSSFPSLWKHAYTFTFTGSNMCVNWGDGTVEVKVATGGVVWCEHTYSSNYTGYIKFYFTSDNLSVTTIGIDGNVEIQFRELFRDITSIAIEYGDIKGRLQDLPSGLTSLYIQSEYNLRSSNDIKYLPSAITRLSIYDYNDLTGDVALNNLPNVTSIILKNTKISTYTTRSWGNIERLELTTQPGYGLSTAEVDQLLIDLSGATWIGSTKKINITDYNDKRSTASDAAVATLTSAGVTVTTSRVTLSEEFQRQIDLYGEAETLSYLGTTYTKQLELDCIGGTTQNLSVQFHGALMIVDWGDGSPTAVRPLSTGSSRSHTYASSFTGKIKLFASANTLAVTGMYIFADSNVTIKPEELFRTLESVNFYEGAGNIDGLMDDMPEFMYSYNVYTENASISDIALFPLDYTTTLKLKNFSALTGDIGGIDAPVLERLSIETSTIGSYTGRDWGRYFREIKILPVEGSGLTTSEVDLLLNDLAEVTTWYSPKTITINGNNSARSSASDAAITTLQDKGVTIYVNV